MTKDHAPRMRGITFTPKTDGMFTGVSVGPNGEVVLLAGDKPIEVVDAKAAEWRNTSKGLKVSSQIDLKEGQLIADPERTLDTQDFVFGVDTNQIQVDGTTVNVSSMTCATGVIPEGPYRGSIQQLIGLDFVDQSHTAERIGWLFALKTIMNSTMAGAHKITLCTDHDLSAHSAINRREQSIIGDFYLPENITLMYARDAGSTIQNKCVRLAHVGAVNIGRKIKEQRPPMQHVVGSLMAEGGMERVRFWNSDAWHKYFRPGAKPYNEQVAARAPLP